MEVTPLASSAEPRVLAVPAEAGSLRLDNPEAGLTLVCAGGDGLAVSCEQTYLPAGASFTPRLGPGVKLAGEVTVGPAPVAGAHVALVPKALRSARFVRLPLRRDARTGKLVREVLTDKDGRFRTPELAPGDYLLEVVAPGGRILHSDPFTVPRREVLLPNGQPGAEAVLDLDSISFAEGAQVEIFVTGPGGEPLPAARVGAHQGATPETSRLFEAEVDRSGKAVLAGLDPAQPVSLACQAAGYLVVRQDLEAPPSAFMCAMQALSLVEGKVRAGEGRPVAGATVSLRGLATRTATDGDGHFSMPGLAPGTYQVTFAAAGFKPERVAVELEPGERRTLPTVELLPGREIRGLIRDARSEKPIAGASVTAVDPPGAVSATSDEAGELTFTLDGDDPLRLQVTASGYPARTVEVKPEQAREKAGPWVIELSEGGRIHVAVWDEEAEGPCQGCDVTISGEGGWRSVTTDAAGEALSEPVAPGRYSVSPSVVQSFGTFVTRRGGFDAKWVAVRSGVLASVDFGDRSPSLLVRFSPGPPGDWRLTARAGAADRAAERLDERTFKLRKPLGGPVSLGLSNSLGGSTQVGMLAADDDRKVVNLALSQAQVRGTLVKDDAPVGAQWVKVISVADAAINGSALTASDGSFVVPFLPPGTYAILVDGRPLRSVGLTESQVEDLGRIPLGS